jgi:hypothetical protein
MSRKVRLRPRDAQVGSRSRSADRAPRWALVALVVAGLALIALPIGFGMFSRAPKGATMLSDFKPFMTTSRLDGFRRDIREVNDGVRESNTKAAAFLTSTAPAGSHKDFAARFREFADFAPQWPPINTRMTNLIVRIQDNLPNYQAMAALPSFTLFPWFFAIPGVLLLILAGLGLTRLSWRRIRVLAAVLGLGLVLAPVAFQMFSRAPAGARMMAAFKTIETRRQVETIQGYFGTIGLVQGAIRLQIAPALGRAGLRTAEIAHRFPAVTALDRDWVGILGDMTPMIGAMSDNVENYQALTALPSFRVFPWLFVAVGVLVAAAALAPGPRRRASPKSVESTSPQPRGAT